MPLLPFITFFRITRKRMIWNETSHWTCCRVTGLLFFLPLSSSSVFGFFAVCCCLWFFCCLLLFCTFSLSTLSPSPPHTGLAVESQVCIRDFFALLSLLSSCLFTLFFVALLALLLPPVLMFALSGSELATFAFLCAMSWWLWNNCLSFLSPFSSFSFLLHFLPPTSSSPLIPFPPVYRVLSSSFSFS